MSTTSTIKTTEMSSTSSPSTSIDSTPSTPPILSPHAKELLNLYSFPNSILNSNSIKIPISFFKFLFNSVKTILLTLLFSPLTFLSDPISTLSSLIIYPIIYLGLYFLSGVFYLTELLGGNSFITYLGDTYGEGLSPVNWANPAMFGEESNSIVEAAKLILIGQQTTYGDVLLPKPNSTGETHTLRIFSIDLSITLLLISSIVYERNDSKILEAAELMKKAIKPVTPSSTILDITQISEDAIKDLKKAGELLIESEARIRKQANQWGMRFEVVSDLASISGPFASIFYNQEGEKPFIILVFKGTGLSNFAEFLVDANITRVSSRTFLGGGEAHSGFYSDLFPTSNGGSDGYGMILRHLHRVSLTLRKDGDPPVPLWITGHSLGSSLASLLHFRFLFSPSDLHPSHLILRDTYAYGTPRLGSNSFTSQFNSLALNPLDRPNILWRVRDFTDFVPTIPPGLDLENTSSSSGGGGGGSNGKLGEGGTLDYNHIGIEVILDDLQSDKGVERLKGDQMGDFFTRTEIGFVRTSEGPLAVKEGGEKGMSWVVKYAPIPELFKNHFPANYYKRLIKLKSTMKQISENEFVDVVPGTDLKTTRGVGGSTGKSKFGF